MPTCGRTVCIGESLYSFINQSYPNLKLIILDTHPQNIKFNIELPPNISYIKGNSTDYKNLGEKFKHLISMVDTELFCIWEDDDLWLLNHFEQLVEAFVSKKDPNKKIKVGNMDHFLIMGGVNKPISLVQITRNYCWSRYVYENKNLNIDNIEEPFDIHFLPLFETVWSVGKPTYIYRWDNGQGHMSGLYGVMSYNELYRRCEDDLMKNDISNITVEIKWRHDYPTFCKSATPL